MALPQLFEDAIGAHHNPSYFVLLHYWMRFGDDEWMLRFPSAVAGALAAATTAALGCVIGGPPAGLVAGTLFAIAPIQVHYGQEARMYAMLTWTATLAATGLLWLGMHAVDAAHPVLGTRALHARLAPAAEGGRTSAATAAWTAYVAGMIGTLYLHNTAVVFAATACIAALALLLRPFQLRLRFWINFIAANLVVLAAWAPYLGTQLAQAQRFSQSSYWAKFPSTADLVAIGRELYLLTAPLESPLAILVPVAAVIGAWSLRKRPEVALATVSLAIVGPVLLWIISLYKPMFGTRLLLWSTPAFFALAGAGVAGLVPKKPWLSWLACAGFACLVACLARPRLEADYERTTNEPWREVVWMIRQRDVPGARVLTATYEESIMLEYYAKRRSHPLLDVQVDIAPPRRGAWGVVRGAPRVWLIDRKAGHRFKRAYRELVSRGAVRWDRVLNNKRLRVVQFDFTRR